MKKDAIKDTILDKTRKYRYVLSRQWGANDNNFANFVLLNPSTADEGKDDQTIRRCINLTKSWKYDGFYVTNLFAFRTRHPKILKKSTEPIGEENDKYLKQIAKKSKIVVIAWGTHGNFLKRDEDVLKLISSIKAPYCLEITKYGHPKHPLTIRSTAKPIKYDSCGTSYNMG